MRILSWSLKRVLLVASLWPACMIGVILLFLVVVAMTSLGGVGAVSDGSFLLAFLTIIAFGPALLLVTIWYAARRWHPRGHLPRERRTSTIALKGGL
jgi:hypothetical protein